jgi:hypothetical protein
MHWIKNYTLFLQLFLKNGIFVFAMLDRGCSKHVHKNLLPQAVYQADNIGLTVKKKKSYQPRLFLIR